MKLSLNWLNEFVRHGLLPEKLAERLTMAGHEVKSIDQVGEDRVFEIEITPNRPDCLNVLGLAREVSAIVNKPLKVQENKSFNIPKVNCDITIEDRQACPRYIGAVIENISITESPAIVRGRLQAIGLRPINNVVDITNYSLFENGQPLHAFDYDKLIGGKIIVRRARAGETIVTLDGVERKLDPSILVIADSQRPVAIAGIMGGAATEVTAKTKRILLESACFDPVLIRRAGRTLGLTSDSAYRFERGVDITRIDRSAKRALGLILESANGIIKNYRDVSFGKVVPQKSFVVNLEATNKFLGTKIPSAKAKTILSKLEFKVAAKGNRLSVTPPSFRKDVKADVDIAEELARIIGYDRVPSSLPQIKPSAILSSEQFMLKRKLRRVLVGQGLDEAISYPLVSRVSLEKSLNANRSLLKIKNPLSLDQEYMRPSLLPSLLAVVLTNFNRGQKDLRLFELGKTYSQEGEKEVLGVILTGSRAKDWRINKKENVDFYDLKGILSRTLEAADFIAPEFQLVKSDFFANGQAAEIVIHGEKVGILGKVSKEILKNWDIKTDDLYYGKLSLESLHAKRISLKHFKSLPEFPAITRDVSLAVKRDIPFSQIEALARRTGGAYLIGIHFLEQYLGEKIPAGQKGLVFSLVYQASDRTLTENEIVPTHNQILRVLVSDLGAVIR